MNSVTQNFSLLSQAIESMLLVCLGQNTFLINYQSLAIGKASSLSPHGSEHQATLIDNDLELEARLDIALQRALARIRITPRQLKRSNLEAHGKRIKEEFFKV